MQFPITVELTNDEASLHLVKLAMNKLGLIENYKMDYHVGFDTTHGKLTIKVTIIRCDKI